MKTLPQVRFELTQIAKCLKDTEHLELLDREGLGRVINRLVKSMHRRKCVRRANIEHATITPELLKRIKQYATQHPTKSYAFIGNKFNVAIGRVSEALVGRRELSKAA